MYITFFDWISWNLSKIQKFVCKILDDSTGSKEINCKRYETTTRCHILFLYSNIAMYQVSGFLPGSLLGLTVVSNTQLFALYCIYSTIKCALIVSLLSVLAVLLWYLNSTNKSYKLTDMLRPAKSHNCNTVLHISYIETKTLCTFCEHNFLEIHLGVLQCTLSCISRKRQYIWFM